MSPLTIDVTTYTKLIAAAMMLVANEKYCDSQPPGPYDDAQSELDDERLLIAAREFVAAHEGQEVVGG